MNALRAGANSPQVKQWQFFLVGQGYQDVIADGDFGPRTHTATVKFQKAHGLYADGVVGNDTFQKAMSLGYKLINDPGDTAKKGINWPPKPDFTPLAPSKIQERFGPIQYTVKPNGSDVTITNGWDKTNLQTVDIPQLKKIAKPHSTGRITFHKKAAGQVQALFAEWEKKDLLKYVLTYEGSYNPRLIRGSSTNLSTHAFGIAFDINYNWNKLNTIPALVGEYGSVRLLVETANKHGFYWGGHFSRLDGMHFEIAKIL